MLFAPNFLINQKDKFVIIEDNTSFEELRENLIEDTLLNDVISFSVLSKLMSYDQNIKIGAYKVKNEYVKLRFDKHAKVWQSDSN